MFTCFSCAHLGQEYLGQAYLGYAFLGISQMMQHLHFCQKYVSWSLFGLF